MGFVTLRRITGTYEPWKYNDNNLTLVETLLTDCLRIFTLNHMNDPKYENKEILGDLAYVRFIKNNKIVIGIQYSQDYSPEIIVDRDNLKEIIERWEQLKKTNVDEIVLKRDKTKIYIVGRPLTEEEKKNQEDMLNTWYKLSSTPQVDKKQLDEFQEKWRTITPDEAKELECVFFEQL